MAIRSDLPYRFQSLRLFRRNPYLKGHHFSAALFLPQRASSLHAERYRLCFPSRSGRYFFARRCSAPLRQRSERSLTPQGAFYHTARTISTGAGAVAQRKKESGAASSRGKLKAGPHCAMINLTDIPHPVMLRIFYAYRAVGILKALYITGGLSETQGTMKWL